MTEAFDALFRNHPTLATCTVLFGFIAFAVAGLIGTVAMLLRSIVEFRRGR